MRVSYALSNCYAVVLFAIVLGENSFPTPDCFLCDVCPSPNRSDIEEGQCIVRTLYIAVDATQRFRMNKSTGFDHLEPFEPGNLVDGQEGIGVVEMTSLTCALHVGDLVTSVGRLWPWSRLFVADQADLMKVTLPPEYSPSVVLSAAGLSAMAALLGIRKKAEIDRRRPQTFVVSGAAGSCGSVAGQCARLEGCTKVIGICGSDNKCQVLLEELGFDGAINYKKEAVLDGLKRLAPEGVDIYFDNVGGFVSDAVIAQMNHGGRVVLCGQISLYNTNLPYPFPIPKETAEIIAQKNIKREGFMVLAYRDDLDSTVAQLSAWLQEGKIKVKETIYEGLERAPQAFVDMMKGVNIGKMMVKVD
ncbi:unnamed protein product [Enterobius vermicularis]|uniref:15-oxoprostaglandin 13-reductase n=1 Tax=Enterobius vermicularis TaxID=51028 RepID=A0A0N4UYH5_ENTVE|nr:unnamed protein product [Enterobius vermicularis]